VYKCRVLGTPEMIVGLKTFQPQYLSSPTQRTLFLREGLTWVRLNQHPCVVTAYQVEYIGEGREVYITLEWIEPDAGLPDSSLRSHLKARRLPMPMALHFALQIAIAMRHATRMLPHLVHLDLKPENVLIDQEGTAHITDFGISLAASTTAVVAGTPEYMAPEQFHAGPLDQRADIYAFGCILYEMIAGQRPVARSFRSPEERFQQYDEAHTHDLPTSLRLIASTTPPDLERLVIRCLEKQPRDRYGNWDEIVNILLELYPAVVGSKPWDEGEALLRKVLQEMVPSDFLTGNVRGQSRQDALGRSYEALGWSYFDLGNYQQAEETFTLLLQPDSSLLNRYRGLNGIGEIRGVQGVLGEALRLREELLGLTRELGDMRMEMAALHSLGNIHNRLEQIPQAIDYYEQALTFAKSQQDLTFQGKVENNLSVAYRVSGDVQCAMEHAQRATEISRTIDEPYSLLPALFNLAVTLRLLGKPHEAIIYFQEQIALSRSLAAPSSEQSSLASMGLAYLDMGNFEEAIKHTRSAVEISQRLGNLYATASNLNQLGSIYGKRDLWREAQTTFQDALELASSFEDNPLLLRIRNNLATANSALGDVQFSLDQSQAVLEAARAAGNPERIYRLLLTIGTAHEQEKQYNRAVECYDEAIELSKILPNQTLVERAYSQKANSLVLLNQFINRRLIEGEQLRERGHFEKAVFAFNEVLEVSQFKLGFHTEGLIASLGSLGMIHRQMGKHPEAISYNRRLINIAKLTNDLASEGKALHNLGNIYRDLRDFEQASNCYEQAYPLVSKTGDVIEQALVLRSMGELHFHMNVLDSSEQYFRQAAAIFRQQGNKPMQMNTIAWLALIEVARQRQSGENH